MNDDDDNHHSKSNQNGSSTHPHQSDCDAKHEQPKENNKTNISSYDSANLFSKIYCLYILPFLWRNYRKSFDINEIDCCSKDDKCDKLVARLRRNWDRQLQLKQQHNNNKTNTGGKQPSLFVALFQTFGWYYAIQDCFNLLIFGVVRMLMPLALCQIIHYSELYREEIAIAEKANNDQESTRILNQTSIDQFQLKINDNATTINSTSIQPETERSLILGLFPIPTITTTTKFIELSNAENVILFASILCLLVLMNFALSMPYFMRVYRFGMNVRVSLTGLIYEKALRVTNSAVQRVTTGMVVNLISKDVGRFDFTFVSLNHIYLAPFHSAIAMYLLYSYLGRSSLGILVLIAFYLPLQSIMMNMLSRFRSASVQLTDNRLRLMAEILPAMRVIKMYAWEKPFSVLVHIARKLEITKIRHAMILESVNMAIFFVADKTMVFLCIILFLLDGGKLNAELVFVSVSLIHHIRELMTLWFPLGISALVETYISLNRIQKFLLEIEVPNTVNKRLLTNGNGNHSTAYSSQVSESCKISLQNVTVNSEVGDVQLLKDISFEVIPGQLTVIIGPVGSGKSSVLLSILGELPHSSGQIDVNGKLIYASQEAWIFNGTVRENILFGREYDAKHYRKVVKVAALDDDLKQFPKGDQTMVDDRGTSLSGGQRARISLARALYTDSDCILLDDPLSAVDASVAKHIFEKCIKGYLKNKCVILVTHQLQFVKQADQIVVLKNGECIASGSYNHLLSKGIDLFKYSASEPGKPVITIDKSISLTSIPAVLAKMPFSSTLSIDSLNNEVLFRVRADTVVSEVDSLYGYDQISHLEFDDQIPKVGVPLLESSTGGTTSKAASANTSGKPSFKIYIKYFNLGAGMLLATIFVLTNLMAQLLFTGIDYWLSEWTNYHENLHIQSEKPDIVFKSSPFVHHEENVNIIIYSSLVLSLFCFGIIRTVLFYVTCMRASVKLHDKMFDSLIHAPIWFFDKTPIGLIMNRVSRDLGIIDDLIPTTAFDALEILGGCLATFILVAILNTTILLPLLIFLILIYLNLLFYMNTARELKRLEATARSPLFNQMASTLSGLPTIRSYGAQQQFLERFFVSQDRHSATLFTFFSAGRFFGICLEFLCVSYICCLVASLLFDLKSYTGSVIGLTISQSLSITGAFNYGVRQYTEVETQMTSVERVFELSKLEREPLNVSLEEPGDSWPANGDISFENVSLQYSKDVDPVLKELTFTIRGGEKIGIVGRTGAGKSSLIATLFRLTEPIGSICIDGIETSKLSLFRLRKSLAIIPQEPILFSGDIRRNLDPFREKTDEELWNAVEKVQLKAKIQSLPGKLDSPVSDCGSDFSVGQKQLICMARAILRQNRILILDEATANVDPRTDSLIQQTIRIEFEHCTVLTIAHRLNTIIDYDRVMVMDNGYLSQFDTPHNLITKESGIFYELFDNLNQETKDELRALAQAH